MTNQENALKVIRYIQSNVEGLKELSEGCKGTIAGVPMVITAYKNQVYWFLRTNTQLHEGLRKSMFEESFKIIGHEPELNHLLLAIDYALESREEPLNFSCTNNSLLKYLYFEVRSAENDFIIAYNDYDLTKSVRENLESNPELTNYCLTLFNL